VRVLSGALLGAIVFAATFEALCLPIGAAWAGVASPPLERQRKPLGVAVAPVPPGAKGVLLLDKDRGMVVVAVAPGSLADQAGLHKGDVLLAVNGRQVNREDDLRAALGATESGGEAVAEISRRGKVLAVAIAY
jgi:S1-C subfamily serine protease